MIEYLKIKNLVLMDLCEISFSKGLTIITGETGAGKTALTQGILLILGERADSSLVRKGEEKAHIEARFSISDKVLELLNEHGIDHDGGELLSLTREISKEGKSRAFINNQMVTLQVLQKIGSHLVHLIGQHSYHELRSSETQREIVDLYGMLQEPLALYKQAFQKQKESTSALFLLQEQLLQREREYEIQHAALQELKEADLKENEEPELFETYSLYSKAQEIGEKSREISRALSEGPRPIIKELSQFKYSCEQLCRVHSSFAEQSALLQEAIVALQEVDHTLQKTLHSLDHNPQMLDRLESRLSLYNKIKKKYGPTYNDWMQHLSRLEEKIAAWQLLDEAIEKAREEVIEANRQLDHEASALTEKRQRAAMLLAQHLSSEIEELNMPGAQLLIDIRPADKTPYGADQITFWLQANKGEKPSSLKDSTSGGELSRLLLAIKTTLAEKNNTPTIIFDEIDANVGGTTATLIGEKLAELALHRQIFCITHFAQVAKKADLHLRVYKQDKEGRTVARMEKLSAKEKDKEILRMLGGEASSKKSAPSAR